MQLSQLLKVARELGIKVLIDQAYYQFLLRTGLAKLFTLRPPNSAPDANFSSILLQKDSIEELLTASKGTILSSADQICAGEYRPYGAEWQKFCFPSGSNNPHWTYFERHSATLDVEDIKDIWEPSRFTWALWLANAYILSKNEKYAKYFWEKWLEWQAANPPYYGPNWSSAQEVAIRIIIFSFVFSVLKDSQTSTPARVNALSLSIFQHASRIPPTLVYARAQRNNHLLSEAAGLLTAGYLFSSSPHGKQWFTRGWRIFNTALQDQIDSHGDYIQHSVNYHRLMLQLAVWVDFIRRSAGYEWPQKSKDTLCHATNWLSEQVQPTNGTTPNSGHNDGSDLFPLGSQSISDYRPILQAAGRAFCDHDFLHKGEWDELSLLFGLQSKSLSNQSDISRIRSFAVNRLGDDRNHGFINIPHFAGRPAHADLLHVDIWKDGYPLTLDAGTFRYNATDPWQNSLARTTCHNTITVDGKDQMTHLSRFLWVDKASCRIVEQDACRILAEHDGYHQLGLLHQRALAWLQPDTWLITDALLPTGNKADNGSHSITLHWLVPLSTWYETKTGIELDTPTGKVALQVSCNVPLEFSIISAGEYRKGSGQPAPTLGWYSPTYSQKVPALSLCWKVQAPVFPLTLTTRFILDKNR